MAGVIGADYLARLPLTDRMTFAIELLAAAFYGVFAGLALPLIPIVARRIGMSAEAITAMVTMQFVGALFGIVVGHMADRRPKMPFAVWPSLVSRALIGLLVFAQKPAFYLAVVSAFNLLVNIGGPAYASIMRTNYSDANRGRLMGNIRIAVVIVSAVFSALAGVLLAADERIVRWLFPAAALFGVMSSLTFRRIRVRKGSELPARAAPASFVGSFRASFGIVRRNVPFLLFLGLLVVCATPDKMAIPLEPLWLVDHLRIGYGDASLVLGTVTSVASIAGYFLWARALKRANSFAVLSWIVFVFAARFAALALARSSAGLVPMSILSGLSFAGWDLVPIFCMISLSELSNFSLYIGLHTTLFGIRGILGPWIGTLLYSSGALPISAIFWLICGILTVGAALMFLFSRRMGAAARKRG